VAPRESLAVHENTRAAKQFITILHWRTDTGMETAKFVPVYYSMVTISLQESLGLPVWEAQRQNQSFDGKWQRLLKNRGRSMGATLRATIFGLEGEQLRFVETMRMFFLQF
jgi:hypothetical protein